MTIWMRALAASAALLLIALRAAAQDVPLGGKVKNILLGSWVKVDEPAGLSVDQALEKCDTPMLSEAYLMTPGRASYLEQLPAWRNAKGDLAFFEHDNNLYLAGPTAFGFNAALYDHARMLSEETRALIIGINTWTHSPNAGFGKTLDGVALETVPVSAAIANGVVGTDQFYLQIGQRNDTLIAILLTYVDRNAARTDLSVEYVRCGDITGIVTGEG